VLEPRPPLYCGPARVLTTQRRIDRRPEPIPCGSVRPRCRWTGAYVSQPSRTVESQGWARPDSGARPPGIPARPQPGLFPDWSEQRRGSRCDECTWPRGGRQAMSTNQVLLGAGLILVLAVGSQVVASRLRIPALIVMLPAGFTAGALTTDVNPDRLLGAPFQPLVPLSVAVSLYDSGLALPWRKVR